MPVQVPNQQPLEPMDIDLIPNEHGNSAQNRLIAENSTIDLDVYANSYIGIIRLHRLIFIADHCPSLKIEALNFALQLVQATFNVELYKQIHAKLKEVFGSSNPPDITGAKTQTPFNSQWIETQTKKAALRLEKLDADLQNYKSNSIKESIRRCFNTIGDHHLDCGDVSNALKCYTQARNYCSNNLHIINMCMNVIKVSIYLQNWPNVQSYINKAEGHEKDMTPYIVTKLQCAKGLSDLVNCRYKSAAKNFLEANYDNFDFPEVLSHNNVAAYGTLCALATYNRKDLHQNVMSNSSFKQFLEFEPQLRDMIYSFYESKYTQCLKLMDEMKDNLYLDIYLSSHVETLYREIRNNAMIQYFSPYTSACLFRMASAFNTTVGNLEDELMHLILEDHISARIDSHKKIIYAKTTDQRSSAYQHFINLAKDVHQKNIALTLRSALIRNNICIRTPHAKGAGELGNGGTNSN